MHKLFGLGLVAGAWALGGCATMSEQECLVSDWRTVGFTDGAAGRPVETIGHYSEACAKHGVAPDLASYRAGHEEGMAQFCQPSRGFEYGHRGARYQGTCPSALEGDFLAGYNQGHQLFVLESSVRSLSSQLAQSTRALDQIKKDITAKEAQLIAEGTSAQERVTLLADAKELSRRQGEVEAHITELERQKAVAERDLSDYSQTLAYGF